MIKHIGTYSVKNVISKEHIQGLKSLYLIDILMLSVNDIKEQLSYAYIHAVASRAGFAYEKTTIDRDSIDTSIKAKGMLCPESVFTSPSIDVQAKATTRLTSNGDTFRFELPIKNYRELRGERQSPAILVVLSLPSNEEEWLAHTEDSLIAKRCAYWVSLKDSPDSDNTETITIDIPKSNVFSPNTLKLMMRNVSISRSII